MKPAWGLSWTTRDRIHHVSCTIHSRSEVVDPADFDRVEKLGERLRAYARKLGFDVMYENVDRVE